MSGMSFIAALFLNYTDEEDAFLLLLTVFSEAPYLLRELHIGDRRVLHVKGRVLQVWPRFCVTCAPPGVRVPALRPRRCSCAIASRGCTSGSRSLASTSACSARAYDRARAVSATFCVLGHVSPARNLLVSVLFVCSGSLCERV